MNSAASRMRALRQRRGAGRILLQIEADEIDLATALIREGFLPAGAEDDKAAVEAAVERVLVAFIINAAHNA